MKIMKYASFEGVVLLYQADETFYFEMLCRLELLDLSDVVRGEHLGSTSVRLVASQDTFDCPSEISRSSFTK